MLSQMSRAWWTSHHRAALRVLGRLYPLRLRTVLLLMVGLWLLLRQVDGALTSLQFAGSGAYGANDLVPLNPGDAQDRAKDLLAVWSQNRQVAYAAFWTYTGLDLLFIWLYWVFFTRVVVILRAHQVAGVTPLNVARGLRSAEKWVTALAVSDLAEDVLRAFIVGGNNSGWLLTFVGWLATWTKWLLLITVLILIAAAWAHVGWNRAPWSMPRDRRWALRRLRVPLVLLVAWGGFVIFDPTAQTADTFRRWLDSRQQFGISAGSTFVAVAVLGFATWTTARRSILAHYRVTPVAPAWWKWGGAGAVLAAVGIATGWLNLLGLTITIAVVFLLEFVVRVIVRPARAISATQERDAKCRRREVAKEPDAGRSLEVRRFTLALSVWPAVALLLALACAWIGPAVVLLALGEDEPRAVPAAVLTPVALALAALIVQVTHTRLPADAPALGRPSDGADAYGPGGRLWPDQLEWRHVAVGLTCLCSWAIAIAWPFDVPQLFGAVGMTALAFAVVIVLLGEGQRYGDTHPPTRGLTFVGFARVPITLGLAIAFVVASFFNDGSYHAISRNDEAPPGRAGTSLQTAFSNWTTRNCANNGVGERELPMVLVAAPGGGIRAAYWTSSVLDRLLGTPAEPANDHYCHGATTYGRVFAMGGVSGGSVGITAYATHAGDATARLRANGARTAPWYRDALGDKDLVAVPTTWGLLVDLPRNLIGFDGPDRARRFEQAFEREDPGLTKDFFASQGATGPFLLLGGTQVESGCRLNISRLRLTAPTDAKEQGECAALAGRPSAASEPEGERLGPVLPTAALTSDVLDYLCDGGSLNRSTAALMSARFPYVSPSGELKRCSGGRPTAVVDGGYAENTGVQVLLDLWARLQPLVAEHNRHRDRARIVPIFVLVDNHYAKTARAGPVGRTQELLVPPRTAGRPDQLDDHGVEQLANATFSVAVPGANGETCQVGTGPTQRFLRIAPTESPGVPAPLAWTLSKIAMDDLDRQRTRALAVAPASTLLQVLRGGDLTCTRPEAGSVGP
jgi:hypothetical protein